MGSVPMFKHGYPIVAAEVEYGGAGIDTPENYDAFVKRVGSGRSSPER